MDVRNLHSCNWHSRQAWSPTGGQWGSVRDHDRNSHWHERSPSPHLHTGHRHARWPSLAAAGLHPALPPVPPLVPPLSPLAARPARERSAVFLKCFEARRHPMRRGAPGSPPGSKGACSRVLALGAIMAGTHKDGWLSLVMRAKEEEGAGKCGRHRPPSCMLLSVLAVGGSSSCKACAYA